ncbi:hypothetical protein [Polyangium sp. 15x6]|uniref:hypothetical protein n=1 Tax=Polyangium sp. 15x6 TaxID=3042687 RepID=UPI00249AB1F5|nr:hypothetical protein [Polyangium sp. 15x6]MDI3291117.1 hypothetical protein [Polyangium sp. 15x6]
MKVSRLRTIFSFGLLGCATAALVPLGCGATVRQLALQDDRPRVPDATAERLRACVDEFGGDLSGGYYTFDVAVKVDEDGRVVDVASTGVPHADLAGCMRIALRGMTVPEELLRLRKLRLSASPAPANGQTAAERGLVGHPSLVVVAIALADLIIEAAPIVVVIAASVEIGKSEIAEVGRKKSGPVSCQDHLNACLGSPWADLPGHVEGNKRCATCFELCKGSGTWPKGFELTDESWASCIYPHIRWYY